jgi:pyruvate/2-oxoglutarate dehydrogenase complex dihydrolipoamide dehydrogenase (E3) component
MVPGKVLDFRKLGAFFLLADEKGIYVYSVALMGGEFTVDELINTMYPHPTLNEVFPEAARAVYGRALNM